jgi:D-amino-acid dehydrogenase
MNSRDTDVLVLGGGVVGLACALYLLRAGRSVRVLERGGVGGETSHGNCGTLTPSHAPPLASPASLAKGLKWMLRPDAPLYIRPRADPALAAWLLHFAGRCNRRDWWRTARVKGALLQRSRALIEELVRSEGLDCGFRAFRPALRLSHARGFDADRDGPGRAARARHRLARARRRRARRGRAGAARRHGRARSNSRTMRSCARSATPPSWRGACASSAARSRRASSVRASRSTRRASAARAPRTACARARDVLVALGPWSARFLAPYGIRLPIQPGKGIRRPTRPRRWFQTCPWY